MKPSSGIEFVHHDLYGVAMDVVRKFVSTNQMRPVLTYTHHAENGDLVATDSHRLIHIRGVHGFKENYLVNPKNFMFAKGNYPDITKLSGAEDHVKAVVLSKDNIKLWLQLFKSINQTIKVMKVSDRNSVTALVLEENAVSLEVESIQTKISLPVQSVVKPENLDKIHFSAAFMRDALEAHFKLQSDGLSIFFQSNMRPFILDDEKMVKTLILPVRKY